MNIYENVATQAIASYFHKEPVWKKKIIFDFLLNPFGLHIEDIQDVITQDYLKETIPDFTIITHERKRIRFEVKINDDPMTDSESDNNTRDAFLIRENYAYKDDIPVEQGKILYWETLFKEIDKLGATDQFGRFKIIREYMDINFYTLLLNPYEAIMFYSPEKIYAVYSMKNKVKGLCKSFLSADKSRFTNEKEIDDIYGIGYSFKIGKDEYFIGLSPSIKKEKVKEFYFSIDLKIKKRNTAILEKIRQDNNVYLEEDGEHWAYFPLNVDLLPLCSSEENANDSNLKTRFNDDANSVLDQIKNLIK